MESLCASSLTVPRGHGLKIHPSPGGFQRRRDQTRAKPASRSADGSLCYCCRVFSWRWRNEVFHQIGDRSAGSRSGVSRSREGAKTAAASGDRGGGAGERAERGDGEKESGGHCAVSPTAGVERISRSGGVCSGACRGVWIEGCGDPAVPGGWEDFLWDAEVAAGLGCGLWGVVGGKESQGG